MSLVAPSQGRTLSRACPSRVQPIEGMATAANPRAAAVLEAVVADEGGIAATCVPSHIATALAEALDNLCEPSQSAPQHDVARDWSRVSSWLERNQLELLKCRSLSTALRTIGSLIGEKPTTELPSVSESRSVPVPGVRRNLLLQNSAAGLTHVYMCHDNGM